MKRMLLVSLFLIFVAGPAQAALIGLTLEEPLISYDNLGMTSYDATTDLFSVDASSLSILLGGPPPSPISNGTFDISIEVDDTGSLVGGVPGDDLSITGDIGAGLVVLLTGEILEFGFEEAGVTDSFDFLFAVTGGALSGLISTGWVGVELFSEDRELRRALRRRGEGHRGRSHPRAHRLHRLRHRGDGGGRRGRDEAASGVARPLPGVCPRHAPLRRGVVV
jgi:hypothetical protein